MDRSSKGTAFLQWHSELPIGWKSMRLRYLLDNLLSGNWGEDPGKSEVDCLCVRIADFDWKRLEIRDTSIKTVRSYTREQSRRFALQNGDLLVEKSGGGEKHPVGRCVQYQGVGSPSFANFAMRLRPNNLVSSDYLRLAFAASYYRGHSWKILNQTTGIQNLDIPAFLSSPMPVPPLKEQAKIVDYLLEKTCEIHGLIEKAIREVELLEQYRRELIAHTVTRGLNPDAPLRDSALGWVDSVPVHWEELRIGSLYDLRSEKVNDVDYPPLSVTKDGIVPQLDHVAKTNDNDNRKLVRAGDFVINSRSDRRGACGIADQNGSCSLINLVLTPSSYIHNPFFSYLFRSSRFADEFYRWGHGIHNDLWTTNWSDMKKILVPVPPLDEQESIAEFLDMKMFDLDSTVAGINKQIGLLTRYRKQLINDAVTGKIRVGEVL